MADLLKLAQQTDKTVRATYQARVSEERRLREMDEPAQVLRSGCSA